MTSYGWVGQGSAATVETKQKSKNIALILKLKWVNIYFNTQVSSVPNSLNGFCLRYTSIGKIIFHIGIKVQILKVTKGVSV